MGTARSTPTSESHHRRLPPCHTGARAPAGGSQLTFAFELRSNVNRMLFEPERHVPFKVSEDCRMEWMVWFGVRKFRVLN